jgi:putative ABC transport system permease protein
MLSSLSVAWTRLRHRRLATALTAASVGLGSALAIALLLLRLQGMALLTRSPHGFDLIVGAKGSGVELTLNTLYHLERSPGTLSWELFQRISADPSWRPLVAGAVPVAVGDSVGGCDIIATTPDFFRSATGEAARLTCGWDPEHAPSVVSGRMFRTGSIDAVVGSQVLARTGLALGGSFRPTHGTGDSIDPSEVHERTFTIVGVLEPTGTIVDRSVYISLEGFWSIDEHERGLHAQAALRDPHLADDPPPPPSTVDADGMVTLNLPMAERRLSAILVRSRSPFCAQMISYRLDAGDEAAAVNPVLILAALLRTLLEPVLRLCALLVAAVLLVGVGGILIAAWQAVQAQAQELAVLRTLGATRSWILRMVVCETALNGCLGALAGIIPGHLAVALVGRWMSATIGHGVPWWQPTLIDPAVILTATATAAVAGLIPAWRACRVQVAELLC